MSPDLTTGQIAGMIVFATIGYCAILAALCFGALKLGERLSSMLNDVRPLIGLLIGFGFAAGLLTAIVQSSDQPLVAIAGMTTAIILLPFAFGLETSNRPQSQG
jgi:hypothetical protein